MSQESRYRIRAALIVLNNTEVYDGCSVRLYNPSPLRHSQKSDYATLKRNNSPPNVQKFSLQNQLVPTQGHVQESRGHRMPSDRARVHFTLVCTFLRGHFQIFGLKSQRARAFERKWIVEMNEHDSILNRVLWSQTNISTKGEMSGLGLWEGLAPSLEENGQVMIDALGVARLLCSSTRTVTIRLQYVSADTHYCFPQTAFIKPTVFRLHQ